MDSDLARLFDKKGLTSHNLSPHHLYFQSIVVGCLGCLAVLAVVAFVANVCVYCGCDGDCYCYCYCEGKDIWDSKEGT